MGHERDLGQRGHLEPHWIYMRRGFRVFRVMLKPYNHWNHMMYLRRNGGGGYVRSRA